MTDGETSPPNDPLALMQALIAQGAGPEEFTRQLFDLNYRQVKADDPALAEMMRACAIPQAIDAAVIGVLRGQVNDATTNEHLLGALKKFEFVLSRQDSGYVYHDNTREMLLAWWRRPENLPQFEQYKERLVDFYTAQGQQHYKQAGYEAALTSFNRAMSLQADSGLLYHWRGGVYLALGNYPAAKNDLEQALVLKFNRPETYFRLATACYHLQDYSAATDNFTKVIDLDPSNVDAYYNRGISYADLGRHERAIEDANQALQLNPEYADAYNNRGASYADLGRHERAIEDYNQALQLNPEDADAYYNRGGSYAALGRHEWAIEDYNRALQLNPEDADAYYNRGDSYAVLGQPKRAIENFNQALQLNPDYAAAYNSRGNSYAVLGQPERAIEDFNQALQLNPDYATAVASGPAGVYRNIFDWHVIKRTQVMLKQVQQALQHTSRLPEETLKAALHSLEYAFKLPTAWPHTRDLLLTMVPSMEQTGYRDEWISYLMQGLDLSRQFGDVEAEINLLISLARLWFQQSRFRQMVSAYRQVIRLTRQQDDHYNLARALTNLGFYYMEAGYWQRAEVLCCHALSLFETLDKSHGLAHTHNYLGILRIWQERWTDADFDAVRDDPRLQALLAEFSGHRETSS